MTDGRARPRKWILPAIAALGVLAAALGWAALGPRARCAGAPSRLDTTSDCGACGVRCAAEHAAAACAAGRCALTCAEGWADCDEHPGNGCEADLRADRTHCGACGKSCDGARCEGGRCAARRMGSGAVVAADAAAVYAVGKTVTRVPLDGGDPAEIPLADAPAAVRAVGAGARRVSDGAHVYWIEDAPGGGGVVKRSRPDGSEVATLLTHPVKLRTLAENPSHVFFADARERIYMAPKRPAAGAGGQ